MTQTERRDEAIERLLRESMRETFAASSVCLDAETAAAWADDALTGSARAAAEAHVAGCARCQALLATLTRIEPTEAPVASAGRGWLTWLVPITAAAAVAGIWVALPRDPAEPPGTPMAQVVQPAAPIAPERPAVESRVEPERGTTPEASPAPPGAVGSPLMQPNAPVGPTARERADVQAGATDDGARASGALRNEAVASAPPATEQAKAGAAPAPTSPAAVPAPAPVGQAAARAPAPAVETFADRQAARIAAPADAAAAVVIVVSPNPAIRWRLSGAAVERSTDTGATWSRVFAGTNALLSGSAPSPTVCWIAGRGGVVLRTTDGTNFARLTLPGGSDPASITATDAQTAIVITTDGRRLETADGGVSWNPRLQEF